MYTYNCDEYKNTKVHEWQNYSIKQKSSLSLGIWAQKIVLLVFRGYVTFYYVLAKQFIQRSRI